MSTSHLRQLAVICCFCGIYLLVSYISAPISAQGSPTVTYIAANNIIVLGEDTGAKSGSQAITIPELAALLTSQGHTDTLIDQSNGIWLLKASILIRTTARLEVTSEALSELRLESSASYFAIVTAQRQGHLLLSGVKVTSWDTTAKAPDMNTADGRSYLEALEGGKLDIVFNSDVGYLGYGSSATGGLVWRNCFNPAEPTTGSTGRVEASQIHDNQFGLFASESYKMLITGNQIYSNTNSGVLMQDSAQGFFVSDNYVFQNGLHGIVFAGGSSNNSILNNKTYDNAQHGILVERGSNNNIVRVNESYGNQDGIAIVQSSNNLVQDNHSHNNVLGLRVSATTDTLATNNLLVNNLVANNSEYGIYLYSNADRNTIRGNTVEGNAENGIYIKSGGNLIENNLIRNGGTGLSIAGGESAVVSSANADGKFHPTLAALDPPGSHNIIISSTITTNSGVGIRISGGSGNRIGFDPSAASLGGANLIEANGKEGIYITLATNGTTATDNSVFGNTIRQNGRSGVFVKDASSVRNTISQNSITANVGNAIKLEGGAQQGILAPLITQVRADGDVSGMASTNAIVEVYSDSKGEAEILLGTTMADNDGNWRLLTTAQNTEQITALVIDSTGNTSGLSERSGATVSPFYTVTRDENNQQLIRVSNGPATISLGEIENSLGSLNRDNLLVELPNGVWQLNANLLIATGITLTLSPGAGVSELQMRSHSSLSPTTQPDNTSFVYLRTNGGVLDLDGVKIYAWDAVANSFDQDITNGRAYVTAKYASILNVRNSELSYLGFDGGENAGVTWRDVNDSANPNELQTRVTGQVRNSQFHHNYYGVYLLQASNMMFEGNKFFDNLRYGFAPRDFSHHFVVENNVAYNNGSHGFAISRGSNNIVLRNNKAYDNFDPSSSQAHGFELDSGTQDANVPEASVVAIILENNEAYNNEGFGLCVSRSNSNQLRDNRFYQNQSGGISIGAASTGNELVRNLLTENKSHGLTLRASADGNILTSNIISENVGNGLYILSSNNVVKQNTVQGNQLAGIALTPDTDTTEPLQNNSLISNTILYNTKSGLNLRGAATTTVEMNEIAYNSEHGIYLTAGANQSQVRNNSLHANGGYGIQMSGIEAFGNMWSENKIYANERGGIVFTNGVSPNILAPSTLKVEQGELSGLVRAGWRVEIFSDNANQGQYFQGQTTADADGLFTFWLSDQLSASQITAIATDLQGNSSTFSPAIAAPAKIDCFLLNVPLDPTMCQWSSVQPSVRRSLTFVGIPALILAFIHPLLAQRQSRRRT